MSHSKSQVSRRIWVLRAVLCAGLWAGASKGDAEPSDKLAEGFANPPDSAKPRIWWHWMNGNVAREGITADLEAMKRVGINGAQIFNVGLGIPAGSAPYMSPQWLDLFRFAATEADRLGMELAFHNCAGWSSSGGPWIRPEQAMQTVVSSEVQAEGGTRLDGLLPQPPTKAGYYRDIAVLAFPSPTQEARLDNLNAKTIVTIAGRDFPYGQQPVTTEVPAGAVIARDRIVNLTEHFSADGRLSWDVPPGHWTIQRIGYTPTGKKNDPAPDSGAGLECDKLSREGLAAHWAGGIEPVLKKLGPLAGKVLNGCVIDSYEAGGNNWTPRFRDEFIKRRGYDPVPFLPALRGYYVESREVTERFLWDFRRTIGDLFSENYYDYFCELCHQHGLKASIEPYEGPFECLQVGAKADILMGEFWAGGGESGSVKLAASEAHTHGIQIVGSESFTATPVQGKWQNHPALMKAQGDLIWCAGVNRFILHCYAHQPWAEDHPPGMTMGRWGTHFGRYNTWWEQSRPWLAYLGRGQYLLQQGRSVADVLFFGGEASPNSSPHRPELKKNGYDYDAVGTDLIGVLSVKDGLISTPSGGSYHVLVLPESTWMTPVLARSVRELAQAGVTIIAPKPLKSPSLSGFPGCDAELGKLADEIWGMTPGEHALGKGRIIWNRPIEEVLSGMGVKPDCVALSRGARLAYVHRVVDGTDFYFVSNPRPQFQTIECAFRVTGRLPELWDAETGLMQAAPLWRVQDGRTIVTLSLEQAGSLFVMFRQAAAAPVDPILAVSQPSTVPASLHRPKLEIRRAAYGSFVLQFGLTDVTAKLAQQVTDGHLHLAQISRLVSESPAGKELRLEYECGGRTNVLSIPSAEPLTLPAAGETGAVRIVRAVYGRFGRSGGLPNLSGVDVTERLKARVKEGLLVTLVDNSLLGSDPAPNSAKELRVEYAVDGVAKTIQVKEDEELRLPERVWALVPLPPRLSVEDGRLTLLAGGAGAYSFTTTSGLKKTTTVGPMPPPMELSGSWEVSFPSGHGAPTRANFDHLFSWSEHADAGIKYFSGTAIYRKSFTIPTDALGANRALQLDLGKVKVIAEVWLNGQNLGILWKAPFRVDVGGAAKVGANELEVRVTNLWPNRLIGDEQYVDDSEWNGETIRRWPAWLLKGEPRPVPERTTFTTWKHWKKDSPLLPSGLLGPVVLRTLVKVPVN